MNKSLLELARDVYRVLHGAAPGMSREQLAKALQQGDRQMRDAVALASEKAAPFGVVLGLDPQDERYYLIELAKADEAGIARARRIVMYLRSYFESSHRRYSALAEAFARGTGQSLDPVQQADLFAASDDPEAILRSLALELMRVKLEGGAARELSRALQYLGLDRSVAA
ncbi:hypothetical protein [Calidithermus chliarophilus]|uniref:hypothetical protein n=1 Tax=Calidithermus chliarophilus TaxID=52023 RepID=UPI0004188385|nr:hypothetical protein [Calidithermus chliarophilus]